MFVALAQQKGVKMKIKNKYFCDDCEIEIGEINKYGLHDLCDKCEEFYQKPIKE